MLPKPVLLLYFFHVHPSFASSNSSLVLLLRFLSSAGFVLFASRVGPCMNLTFSIEVRKLAPPFLAALLFNEMLVPWWIPFFFCWCSFSSCLLCNSLFHLLAWFNWLSVPRYVLCMMQIRNNGFGFPNDKIYLAWISRLHHEKTYCPLKNNVY